jgi:hypothetical protein
VQAHRPTTQSLRNNYMKKFFLFLILFSNVLIAIAQSNWVTTRVGNELSVKFPNNPNSDTKPEKRLTMYTTTTGNGNCYFTVVVRKQAINDYDRIKRLPSKEQENEINSFLDKGISQFIEDGDIITPLKAIKIGSYTGKKLTYNIRGKNGKQATTFAKFIFANNNLYIVSCSIYQQGLYENDKNLFLNSITAHTQTQNTSAIPPILGKGTSKSTVKSSSTSTGTKDNSTASQYETEQWILSKLRGYAPKSYDVPIDREHTSYGVAWIVKDISFSFDTYNLVINYSHTQPSRFGFNNTEESKIHYKVTILIYAIKRIFSVNNDLGFNTDGSVIIEENTTEIKKSVTSYAFVPFNASSETDLVKRLEKAFLHLKKFYTKPDNKELF